jgi:hypothetical protein
MTSAGGSGAKAMNRQAASVGRPARASLRNHRPRQVEVSEAAQARPLACVWSPAPRASVRRSAVARTEQKVASTCAIASPAGVVVSTAQSSATSAQPCFCALAMRPAKSTIERESRSSFAATSPDWPVLWDSAGRGFGRVEDPARRISPRTINSALERARDKVGLQVDVTAHTAKHSYSTNWVNEHGDGELSIEKLSRQVGTSVQVLRATYVHFSLSEADWTHIRGLGEARGL